MMNRNRLERRIRRRRQRMLADINRDDPKIFREMLRITITALIVVIGIAVWFWAAGRQSEMEAQAAVLRSHRITADSMYTLGPGVMPGQNQNRPIMVESLPETPPEDGEPPEAIEIRTATMAEAVPATAAEPEWESLGVWKLTAYCPWECCNGKGRAWKTSSEKPMKVGWTVASYSLPEGTQIMINGHVYCVEDTGVNHIDILYPDHQSASDFGIRKAEVFIKR